MSEAHIDLGRPIAGGRTAEVFALDEGRVLKLLRPGMPEVIGELEASIARAVVAAGVAAPGLLGTERVDGRFGLVYERLRGPSMLDEVSRRPWTIDRYATLFARLHVSMHERTAPGLRDLKEAHRAAILRTGDFLPDELKARALARLDQLPAGQAIVHGDMHPGNVVMCASGPVVIDWLTAARGDPAADVARTLFLMRMSVLPATMPRAVRAVMSLARRRFAASYLRAYGRVQPLDPAAVRAWRAPILAVRLAEDIVEERPALLAALRAELG